MDGQFCMPAGGVPPTTVQVLVHGTTYNHVYWDFPYQAEHYSHHRDMARHGYATFAVDRLGTGQSTSRPAPHCWTVSRQNRSIRSSVTCARAGSAGCVSNTSSIG